MPESYPELYVPVSARSELLRREAERASQSGDRLVLQDGREFLLADMNDPLIKSIAESKAKNQPYRLNPNLYGMGTYQGVKDTGAALTTTNTILRQVPNRNPIIASVISKRQAQEGNWQRLPQFKGDTGFRVAMRNPKQKPTATARQRMRDIENIVLYGGIRSRHPRTGQWGVWNAEGTKKAPGLYRAMRALINDSMTLDAAAIHIETGMNEVKYPVAYWAPEDAALIRYCTPADTGKGSVDRWGGIGAQPYHPEIRQDLKDTAYVMVDQNGQGKVREYAWNELGYLVRNPRTDQWVMGYGWSEIERLIDIITGILYGIRYNVEYFDSNRIPAGLLTLAGNYGDEKLEGLRAQFRMMVGGPGQFWSLPIIASGDAKVNGGQFIPMRSQAVGEGVHWKEWILFCATCAAALWGMDATEINFVNFGTSANALANADPKEKIKRSQETGVEPDLVSWMMFWDENIVQKYDRDFCFLYTGLSEQDQTADQEATAFTMSMALSTPNLERARRDERPICDPIDRDLWRKCRKIAIKRADDPEDPDEIEELTVEIYEAAGGKLAMWPDAPVGSEGALQVWMIEHGMQPDKKGEDGEDGEGSMGDSADPNQASGTQDPGQKALQHAEKQPPVDQQEAIRKSIIEVVVTHERPR